MADVHAPEVRSHNMSAIGSKNTKPELTIRSALHARGFRYRLHVRSLPGSPDLVFRAYNAVLFVHGCFWHGHDCPAFRMPGTRTGFWSEKIAANADRDSRAESALLETGWRVAVVWECALRGNGRRETGQIASRLERWLKGNTRRLVVRGLTAGTESGRPGRLL
ncbi:MAG: DNA mismatch endonuclease Vsr [Alphaproteobacteria bacterium]|nr:MAG: DNA mismatch endonuclease Vsr [Alphaproteobacteria bacterium]